ncbi:MAG: PDZ domain-containing protein [Cellvibrionales bacterium]|nr:PDZ domain-containing protein [Cellvibrionales bacterium]
MKQTSFYSLFYSLIIGMLLSLTGSLSFAKSESKEQIQEVSKEEPLTDIAWSDAQKKANLETLKLLKNKHYEKLILDDALAEKFLNNYLNTIDSNRQVFLNKDVTAFKFKYLKGMKQDLLTANLNPGFAIFNQYRLTLAQLLAEQLDNLDQKINTMTFDEEDSLLIDRSKAPWPKTTAERKEIWEKRLKSAVLSMQLENKKTDEIIKTLSKRYKSQLERIRQLNSEDVFQIYLNTFTELYDPHTNYMSPELSENFNISMSLKLQGIGALLRMKDDYTEVVRLIPGGPAAKKGELKPSDRIVGVAQGENGEMVDIVGWRLDQVVNLIRGEKGTLVRLEVIPAKSADENTRKEVRIIRAEEKLEEQAVKKAI